MQKLLIEDGVITNIIEADADFTHPNIQTENWVEGAAIGVAWVGGAPVIPEPEPTPAPTAADVDAEQDVRSQNGFLFNGKVFDFKPPSIRRITGASSLAHIAVTLQGATSGDLRWHNGPSDFSWIAADNTEVFMDAPTMIAFGSAAALHEASLVWAGRSLKNMDPIPDDYAADSYWPVKPE